MAKTISHLAFEQGQPELRTKQSAVPEKQNGNSSSSSEIGLGDDDDDDDDDGDDARLPGESPIASGSESEGESDGEAVDDSMEAASEEDEDSGGINLDDLDEDSDVSEAERHEGKLLVCVLLVARHTSKKYQGMSC